MKSVKVTVLMSVYNGERFLRKAIESILAQTMPEFEFIIIDDGSPDATSEILASYDDPRMRIVHQENMGVSVSVNRGLEMARTELVARLDADDIALPNRLEAQLQEYERLGKPDVPNEQWQKVKLPIPKRKYQKFLANESDIKLTGCERQFRQIIMKDHGRIEPTYVITNNRELELVDVLAVYARRWRIENKLAELVDFFNINALSSPIMVRIHFDLLLSVAASFLYQFFAKDLPRFENHLAPDIFRRFVDIPGTVRFDGQGFEIHIRKRAHTPILLGVEKLQQPLEIPWLEGRPLKIFWRA